MNSQKSPLNEAPRENADAGARWLTSLPPVVIVCIAFGLAVTRGIFVRNAFENAGSCESCLFWQTFASDLWVVGAIAVLGALQLFVGSRLVKRSALVLQLICLVLMSVDVLLFKILSLRLYIADIGKFGAEFGAIANFAKLYFGAAWIWLLLAAAVLVGAIVWSALRARGSHRRAAAMLAGMALAAFAGAAVGASAQFQFVVEEWVRNWFAMNFDQGVSRPYSPAFAQAAQRINNPPAVCAPGAGSRKNIVLVIVESLSSYHSALLGGNGWTPELDRIAGHSRWFTNFHANGFTTDHGLIALFTGKAPLPSVGRYGGTRAYDGYWSPQGSLPTLLKANGYDTAFLTTGDLRFLEKGEWTKSIGFAHVEGAEHPFYAGMPRMHFHAAPDEALFDRFMQWRAARPAGTPYFAGLLTVSSHPPYIAPDGKHGEEAAIRYVDQQLGKFYLTLRDTGFFDNGLLMVLGDHRAMTLITPEERALHGDRALSRIPLIVASDPAGAGEKIDILGQQADMVHSLNALTGAMDCRPADGGDFLAAKPIPANNVIHVRGDRRSWLSVYATDGKDAQLRLDGDASAWIGRPPDKGESILGSVNRDRIALGDVNRDIFDYMLRAHGGR